MSRYHPDYSIEPILHAVVEWKQKAFGPQKSLFSSTVQSWTPEAFSELITHFVDNLDETENNFWDKLESQLAPVSAAAKILATEIIWLLLLFPGTSNWKVTTKRDRIQKVWGWVGLGEPLPQEFITDEVMRGIGSCGQAYKSGFWRELRYAILMFKSLLEKNEEYRTTILSDAWSWGEWQVEAQENDRRQFRHIISYLLFPVEYEHFSSIEEKRKILAAFDSVTETELREMKLVVLDQRLYELRKRLEEEYKTSELSFYREPLVGKWRKLASEPRYWAGGFKWGDESMLDEFISGNYWRIGYKRDTDTSAGKIAWKRFDEITIGDYFTIKGYGGSHDLVCHYYGIVKEKDDDGNLFFEPLKVKYSGKAPSGRGAGNWQDALLEVKRPEDIKLIFNIDIECQFVSESNHVDEKTSTNDKIQNIILYGPPGTGKTWELINKWLPQYCTKKQTDKEAHEEALREFVSNAVWWKVILYVMVDLGATNNSVNAILEHPVMQMKASLSSSKNVRATLWGNLQMHTRNESETVKYTQRQPPAIFDKKTDSTWYLIDNWETIVPDAAETICTLRNAKQSPGDVVKRYEFVTFHQSYGYEEFIEGLRPELNDNAQISYEVKPGVFQRICNRARLDPHNRYAIFIDEINRGNISKIFGELITLVEIDKRVCYDENGRPDGKNKGIEITLPYSGNSFGVPANLDIIGTMNTADRSIALLDIALRRRFEFRELMPNVEAVKGSDGNGTIENGAIDLRKLLNTLNERIRLLAGRELQLGHAFLCKVENLSELHTCFAHKIIPLLQEYFYGHWERIQIVLGDRSEQLTIDQKTRKEEVCFVLSEALNEVAILGFDHDELDSREDFRVNQKLHTGELP